MLDRFVSRRSSQQGHKRILNRAVGVIAEALEGRVLMSVDPVISEFLASNKKTNKDDDGDSSDWIEIYNPNTTSINLNGYFLTDDRSNLTEWKFPNVSLAGNGYMLVWASGKNRTNTAKPLHTNFDIKASGEYLGLVEPDGLTIASDFSPTFPPQTTDISYGTPPGGGPANFLIPTPAAPNKLAQLVADTKFDHDRGLYTSPFDVAITTATAGASIRYTTDGSMPSTTSGTLYSGPVHISTTTVLRAIAYKTGFTSTDVDDESYIFPADVLKQPSNVPGYPNPQEAINNQGPNEIDVPLDYGMDPDVVNDPKYAQAALNGLSEIPSLSIGVNKNQIFGSSGFYDTGINDDGTEVPISFEYIDPSNPQDNVGVNAGISGHSKPKLKRTFHIHFTSTFGPTKLDDPIFDSAPFGGSSATSSFDDLILRAGNNRSWATTFFPGLTTYTEDEYVRDTQIAMTGQGTHGTFVQLYINGLYWGLYNMVERPDDGYGAAYYGGDKSDWFSVSQDGVQTGDDSRWNFLINTLTTEDMSNSANYAQMQQYLNVKEFSDYLIGQWFDGVSDWPNNNFWAGGDTSKKQPIQFFAWDGEYMMDSAYPFSPPPNGPWVNPDFTSNPSETNAPIVKLWSALKKSPDFMAMFSTEVYKNVANNGPLSDANALARWNSLNASISDAIVDESARWGDSMSSTGRPLRTKNGDWIPATQDIVNDLQGGDATFLSALRDNGYYPSIDPATMSQQGGLVPSGYQLALSNPNSGGTIFYTTDGSDPRTSGTAQTYSGKIKITGNITISLRVKSGSTWSAMNQANFAVNTIANLRVSEIMYNPKPPANAPYTADEYEYIEFTNVGAATLNLNGVQIADGIQFTFGNVSLAPGDHILVVNNTGAFQSLYGNGFNIAGEYSGKLSDNTDEIQIIAPGNITLSDFTYDSSWYSTTNGGGYSLTVIDPTADQSGDALSDKTAWKASTFVNGTPGSGESTLSPGSVVINELLANTSQASGDEIELLNTTAAAIDISGWFLSDSNTNLKKFQIPSGTILAGGGYVVFTQTSDFGSAFTLSSSGETAYLNSADANGNLTGYSDSETFGASEAEVPFERYVNSNGDVKFVAESSATFGAANSAPAVGPVVINEINYNPKAGGAEYLELTNVSSSAVDLSGWSFTKGVTFTFAQGTTIAPGAFILLTPIDPTVFRSTYRTPAGTAVFQFTGALDNSGETIELDKASGVIADSVKYNNSAPWPTGPNGNGPSLAKTTATLFGDDPIAWQASTLNAGTPGLANSTGNAAPTVNAGTTQSLLFSGDGTTIINLTGSASDDTLPAAGTFATTWSKFSGPGNVTFADATQLATTASFSAPGKYMLRLTAGDGTLSSTSDVEIDITTLPVITIVATDASASEPGTNTGMFTISRSGATVGDLTVNLATPTGTATNGTDYSTLPTSVVIPDGQSSVTVTLTVMDDQDVEDTETATLAIAAGDGYTIGTPSSDTVFITDDDLPPPPPVVTIAATDANASEPGTDTGTFTITRSGNLTDDLTVNLAIPTGSATSGVDYTALPTSVLLPDGVASVTVTLTPIDDTSIEGSETVTLALAAAADGTDYTIGDSNSATITIADNDVIPTVTIAATDASASESGNNTGTFTITRANNLQGDLTVLLNAPTGSATSGTDYTALPTSVLIPDGQASVTVTLTPIDAKIVGGTKTATLALATSADYAIGAGSSATVNIADNDVAPPPSFSANISFRPTGSSVPAGYFADNGLVYGDRGNGLTYGFRADASAETRDRNSKSAPDELHDALIQTGFSTTAGSAIWEIAVPNGTYQVTILSGDPNYVDSKYKINAEGITVVNGTPTAANHWITGTATVTVSDGKLTVMNASGASNNKINTIQISSVGGVTPPPLPAVSIAATDASAAEQNKDPGTFTFTRTGGDLTEALTVHFTVTGTATNGSDYTTITTSVTIPANQTSATVTVTPIDDSSVEGTETVILTLATNATYTIGTSAATVNIADNDVAAAKPTVTIAATDASAAEAKSDPGVFTITRSSGDLTKAVTVTYTIGGTATNGSDYKTLTTTVTIPANKTTATVTVAPIDDSVVDPNETVILTLATSSTYTIGATKTATVTIADNDVAKFAAKVHFQTASSKTPAGYVADTGLAYGSRGSGLTYGWSADNTANTRDRGNATAPDSRYDTDIQMQTGGNKTWEIAVPNGTYQVHLVAGDASFFDSVYKLNVESTLAINGTPTSSKHWIEATVTVTVTDGKLTIANASGASNNRIDYIDIQQM